VSTILKALEKLEREKEALRISGPMPPILGAPASAGRGGAAGWFLKPWFGMVLVGLIIVILGGTAWHFYRQYRAYAPRLAERSTAREPQPARTTAAGRSQTVPSSIPAAVNPETRRPGPVPHSPRQTVDVRMPDTASGGPERSQNSAVTPKSRTVETPTVYDKPSRHQPMAAVNPNLNSRTAHRKNQPAKIPDTETPSILVGSEKNAAVPPGSPVLPDAASKKKTPADVYQNTPLLTDGRLRVNAIAWAPQPAERMTVINSHVLHEGDSVEDFTVMVIRPDDVVVQEKGQGVWRVEFGRP
jgi:hypothetical protein